MNIISPFKDYYDFIFPNDNGAKPWLRKTEELNFEIDTSEAINVLGDFNSSLRNILSEGQSNLKFKLNSSHWDYYDFEYSYSDEKKYRSIFTVCIGREVFFIKCVFDEKTKKRVYSHIENLNTKKSYFQVKEEQVQRYKQLITRINEHLCSPTTMFIFDFNKGLKIVKNLELKKYANIIPFSADQVYMLIDNYLSDMYKDKAPPSTGGDEILIQQKGFDKFSFRKLPTKKKR